MWSYPPGSDHAVLPGLSLYIPFVYAHMHADMYVRTYTDTYSMYILDITLCTVCVK